MSQKNNILQRCQNSSWIPTHRSHSHSRTTHLSLLLLSLCLYLNPTVKSVTCQHFQIQPQLLLLLPPPDFPVSFIFLFLHPFFFLPPLRKFTSCQRKILGWFIFYFDASNPSFLSFYCFMFSILLGMGGSYFSLAQWQELELQALIYRYMLAGAAVPPELLQPIKKSLLHSPPYFLHHPLQQYSYYQPACKCC